MEFNPINNFNLNNISQQKAGIVQNNSEQNQPLQNQAFNQSQTPLQIHRPIDPAIFDFQLAKMDNETIVKYLQNLLKLPKTIEKFVEQMDVKNIDPKITQILVENMISTKALNKFLNENSTDAIAKLMQTISTTLKSGTNDISQLKEILSILTTIQTNSQINTNTIKEFLLLYIPLNVPVFDKHIDTEAFEDNEKEVIANSKLSILFETLNYSNILITINEADNNLFVDFYVVDDFPKNEFLRIIEALSNEASIVSMIEFKDKKKQEKQNDVQNFKVISDGFIFPNALILCHMVIKTVLKIDSDFA